MGEGCVCDGCCRVINDEMRFRWLYLAPIALMISCSDLLLRLGCGLFGGLTAVVAASVGCTSLVRAICRPGDPATVTIHRHPHPSAE